MHGLHQGLDSLIVAAQSQRFHGPMSRVLIGIFEMRRKHFNHVPRIDAAIRQQTERSKRPDLGRVIF